MSDVEQVPTSEGAQIENTVRLTVEQLKQRYPSPAQILRGVHAKDHGCVKATFTVNKDIPEDLRVGVFAQPGRCYDAWIRFSNADVKVAEDSRVANNVPIHGSRGMAIKLLDVSGTPLTPTKDAFTQDFLMINSPVFAFANVEDYDALSEVLLRDKDKPDGFFARVGSPDPKIKQRAMVTGGIVKRIQSASMTATPPAFQAPPLSPLDNRYFSAAPFMFGDDRVMKFSAKPVAPMAGSPQDVADRDYLRKALHQRMTAAGAQDIVFEFQVQVRSAATLAGRIETDIEDACVEWKESEFPFVAVATIAIPPQDFDTPERRAQCEELVFTPWHGLVEHRPLGGINRLRREVYEASSAYRDVNRPRAPSGGY